ncbi:TPA_exp: hypothetical protein A8136_4659 [Trichophyton benhamiae CBS 112371]|nr:TPA_exp: hypothetical protein A8136_4659 [Trichophyton benhamiae CBS 112371]
MYDPSTSLGKINKWRKLANRSPFQVTTLKFEVNRNLFQSGDADHAALENGIFVASGRFIYEKGQKPIVDYKVSQVCKG